MVIASYAELYQQHAPAARRLAFILAPDVADDLVSEAFTRVLSAVERGQDPAAFRPYLMAAVRNLARRRETRLVLVAEVAPPPAPSAESVALDADETAVVRAAYAALPSRYRAVLWQTEVEGHTPAQLATVSGMTPNGVAALAARAREALAAGYLAERAGKVPRRCRPYVTGLAAVVRGTAGPRRRREVAAHLESCPRCRGLSAEMCSLNSWLRVMLPAGALPALRVRRAAWSALAHPALLVPVAGASVAVAVAVAPARQAPPAVSVPVVSVRPVASARHTGPEREITAGAYRPRHAAPVAVVSAAPSAPVSASVSPVPVVTGTPLAGAAGTLAPVGTLAQSAVSTAASDVRRTLNGVPGTAGQVLRGAGGLVGTVTGVAGSTVSGLLGGS
jgi:RNA polymerase sigma factor (sigma-70 family)